MTLLKRKIPCVQLRSFCKRKGKAALMKQSTLLPRILISKHCLQNSMQSQLQSTHMFDDTFINNFCEYQHILKFINHPDKLALMSIENGFDQSTMKS